MENGWDRETGRGFRSILNPVGLKSRSSMIRTLVIEITSTTSNATISTAIRL
jgi:hypothetical protein